MRLRIFVPRGGGFGDARLQALVRPGNVTVVGARDPEWVDVPTVYEDPGDEVIPCPVEMDRHRTPDRLCTVCLGEGHARVADIERRMAHLGQAGK